MPRKPEIGQDTLRIGSIYLLFCLVTAMVLTVGDHSTLQTVCINAANCIVGILSLLIAYNDRAKSEPPREKLIIDMRIIDSFPVPDAFALIDAYKSARPDVLTDEEQKEVELVWWLTECELIRANHPAFADDFEALMAAYKADEFHKAMRYATTNWLKAVLIVARSRGDLMADRLLVQYFGMKTRYPQLKASYRKRNYM